MSFTEAEARIIEEVTPFVNGEFEVKKVTKAPYREIAFDDEHDDAVKFYKMKVAFVTLDEKTGKEKFNNVTMLVQADSLRNAIDNLDVTMKGSMLDYISVNAVSTKIVDVFIHKSENVDDDNRPLDVVLVTPENLKVALGRRLVHPILKHWEETFIDEDTKEEVKIDRSDVVFYRGDQVTPEMWAELIERKEHDVTLYR